MSPDTNQNGFTLIELVVAVGIVSVITLAGVRLIFDGVMYRAKQESIDRTDSTVRAVIDAVRDPVQSATALTPGANALTINGFFSDGSPRCTSIRLNTVSRLMEVAASTAGCDTAVHSPLHDSRIFVDTFSAFVDSTHPGTVTIRISGTYADSVTNRPFTVQTSLSSKAML